VNYFQRKEKTSPPHDTNHSKTLQAVSVMLVLAIATLSLALVDNRPAQAILLKPEEHFKYVTTWHWDERLLMNFGLINPKIVIANETADEITGYIGDNNGTRLTMYNGEHYVMARYSYDNGFISKWEMTTQMHDGWFTIEIPQKYRDAQIIGVFISNHQYSVDPEDITLSQPRVFINSARLDYRLNSTLHSLQDQSNTQIASQPSENCNSSPSHGSLIDLIWSQYMQLSTGVTTSTCKTPVF